MDQVTGLHHITANTGAAQADIDFFVKALGQRLAKQTVLFDGDRGIYHFYFSNKQCGVGAIFTTMPHPKSFPQGRKGSGQIGATAFSVPSESLGFWKERFGEHKIQCGEVVERFGQKTLTFTHPVGIDFELIEDDRDTSTAWTTDEVDESVATRSVHNVTMVVRDTEDHEHFMTAGLGYRRTGQEGNYTRFEIGEGGPNRTIFVRHEPDLPQGSLGYGGGTMHHVAINVGSHEKQDELKERIVGLGYIDMSERKDRYYFKSMYVRSPGGILIEVCTPEPGLFLDETDETLGKTLHLPPWFEGRREDLMADLEPVEIPEYA